MSHKRPAHQSADDAAETKVTKKKVKLNASMPTIDDIIHDRLTPIANMYWAPGQTSLRPFDAKVIEDIFQQELIDAPTVSERVVLLELSSYLENYLWKHFDSTKATYAHIMSMIQMINEKFRNGIINVWEPFHSDEKKFVAFFKRVLTLTQSHSANMSLRNKITLLLFLINAFQSLEDATVRQCVLRLTNLRSWRALSPGMLAKQLKSQPHLVAPWKKVRTGKKTLAATFIPDLLEDFYRILSSITEDTNLELEENKQKVLYIERFVEFCVDLNAQLPTRRFFLPLIQDSHFIVRCQMSHLFSLARVNDADGPGKLFSQLIESLGFYQAFEIDLETGAPLTDDDLIRGHYEKLEHFQRLVFKHMRDILPSIPLATISDIDRRASLTTHLSPVEAANLSKLAQLLQLIHVPKTESKSTSLQQLTYSGDKDFFLELLVFHHERKRSQKQETKALPLYPVEDTLWDENMVPSINYTGETVLALPKLNLQFLTFHDYLLRNFNLFRLESTYEIREDLVSNIERLQPRLNSENETVFTGWARMAIPLYSFSIVKVKKPNIGEAKPAEVKANIVVDLSAFQGVVRQEWDNIREHDVMFLLCVQGVKNANSIAKEKKAANKVQAKLNGGLEAELYGWEEVNREELGIVSVRGCEVVCVCDEKDKIIGSRQEDGSFYRPTGNLRTFKVLLDTAQYQLDMQNVLENDAPDVYTTFNLLMRRKPKENNFKAVLATVRDLMEVEVAVPKWLHDVFLGYGDPRTCQYYQNGQQLRTLKFRDTFLDRQHLLDSFTEQVDFANSASSTAEPPYALSFASGVEPDYPALRAKLKATHERDLKQPYTAEKKTETKAVPKTETVAEKVEEKVVDVDMKEETTTETKVDEFGEAVLTPIEAGHVEVESYRPLPTQGIEPKRNAIRFTPMQIAAIKSGLNPGLTMVVGPPGTGKTDTAVQIISELYHNFPNERMLLVTHSNHALNDLFEKIMERDIPERYLLRLGRGAEDVRTDKDFSKFGRVNFMLGRRMELLAQVAEIAASFEMDDSSAYNCEAAHHFFLFQCLSRWEKFLLACKPYADDETLGSTLPEAASESETAETTSERDAFITNTFPFMTYFRNRNVKNYKKPRIFEGNFAKDMRIAESCFKALRVMFDELEETRPFELLRRGVDRGNFLLTKHAKVIAMTCTHAAIQRGKLIDLGFQYDNLIMEEAAQILEIETFIPMLLQNLDPEFGSRLKRVVLLGDHHQLPPVIKNRAFQKYSHLDQSMFTRFVRLGMPYIQLDAQGRSRPSIAQLWNWRYNHLGNLPNVLTDPRFLVANLGFQHEYQFINVEDYNGEGESTPSAYFFQNLGEAEYLVQTYMYMRLMGYPAEKISIITTYNGQKALLRDVIEARCANHPLFGPPRDISTVDKFQGQQNDYILLSMVRSKFAGHVRDVRRLVVAMSRARLGLYIFGRRALFQNTYELSRTFTPLLRRPTNLLIAPHETSYPGSHYPTRAANTAIANAIEVQDLVHMGRIVHEMSTAAQSRYEEYQAKVKAFEDEKIRKAQEAADRERLAKEQHAAQAMEEKELEEGLVSTDALVDKLEAIEQKVTATDANEDEDDDEELLESAPPGL
jgi:intron-binding protein aquarius